MLLARLHAYVCAPLHWHASRMQSCQFIAVLLKCLLRITQHLRDPFFLGIMHRLCCISASVAIACGAVADSGSSIGVPSHPVVNIHLTDSNDAAVLNELADREINLEHLLGALETRAQAAENSVGNQMSLVNAQIHELVNVGSSLSAVPFKAGMMQQLRGRRQENQAAGIPSDMDAQHEVQTLKEQLALVMQDAHSSDKDAQPGAESAEGGFDASGAEAVARQKLMLAQKNFASVGIVVESEDQKAIDSKLASAMESPSRVGSPAPLPSPSDIVTPCQPDIHECPQGWKDVAGACVASSDYAGPCAGELRLSGMNEEQLLAIAKYCRLESPCQ